jgi:hypothetical protein
MTKVTLTGEHHHDTGRVGGFDYFAVAHRATGLDD